MKTPGKKIKTAYVEENICFGRDSHGKNKMIYAFLPLRIVKPGLVCCLVKPAGRGNYREYAILTERLKFM